MIQPGRLLLPVILSATFVAGFDTNVVNVALPSLQEHLHAGPVALELVVGGYAFSYASGLITGGRMGDRYGHRRLLLLGMTAFVLASLLCGLAPAPGLLVLARVLQGATAAAMVPQVLALITTTYPAQRRARALSWMGVTMGLSGVAGQVLGGVLLDADLFGLGWRAIFLVNLPVGALVLAVARRVLPRVRPAGRPSLDPVGVAGVVAALAFALVPLVLGRQAGWSWWVWAALACGLLIGAGTVRWERVLGGRGGHPVLDVSLLTGRGFVLGLAVNAAFMVFFAGFVFVCSLLLQRGLGLSPLAAGVALLPFALIAMAASLGGRGVVARYGNRALVAGCLLSGIAVLLLALQLQFAGRITVLWLQVPLLLLGVGNGVILPAMIGAPLAAVRPAQAGVAAGMVTTTQQFAGAAGVALAGVVFFPLLDSGGYVVAAGVTIWVDLAVVLVMAGLAAALPRPVPAPAAAVTAAAPVRTS